MSSDRIFFADRREAGRLLARTLARYSGRPDVLVLALPRGGVPVGYEIAEAIGAPLDVLVVRKLGVPGQEELAIGAIASGGLRVLDREIVAALRLRPDQIEAVQKRETAELRRRERVFRGDRPPEDVAGRTVILVDDGVATGSTLKVAIATLRQRHPEAIVVAVPVGPRGTVAELRALADEVVCLGTPSPFQAVGQFYAAFDQTTDEEVRSLLAAARPVAPALPA